MLPLILVSNLAVAAQLLEVRDGTTAAARVSATERTRLTIRDGRVHKVWGAEDKATYQADADAGELYITLEPQWRNRAFTIFVKDETGAVYTLALTPADVPGETITLVRPASLQPPMRPQAIEWETSQPYERTLADFLRHIASGKTPPGYARAATGREVNVWREAKVLFVERYVGGRLAGEVYELTNVDGSNMRLDEREFYRPGVLAVSVERHELAPGESTRLYLIVRDAP